MSKDEPCQYHFGEIKGCRAGAKCLWRHEFVDADYTGRNFWLVLKYQQVVLPGRAKAEKAKAYKHRRAERKPTAAPALAYKQAVRMRMGLTERMETESHSGSIVPSSARPGHGKKPAGS